MKNVIGIDLDDVLANTTDNLDKYYNERFGTNIKLQDHKNYMLNDIWNCSFQEAVDITYDFYNSPLFSNILPLEGAQYGIDVLKAKYELIIITSRPEEARENTERWINQYFPNIFKEIVITNKHSKNKLPHREKYEVCLEKNISTMIEDNLHYAMQNANHGIITYLIDRPWNQDGSLPSRIKRVYSWNEIVNDL